MIYFTYIASLLVKCHQPAGKKNVMIKDVIEFTLA